MEQSGMSTFDIPPPPPPPSCNPHVPFSTLGKIKILQSLGHSIWVKLH